MSKNELVPDEEIQRLLKEIVFHFDQEDNAVRERQIRTWRRLKLFWEGFQKAWYSEVAHDWRIWNEETDDSDTDQSYYDKPVNIFRAYLESIIAALSITVPPVKCYPDDADNPLDLSTAKTGDKIAQLVYRHNDVILLWLHALFIFCTEGMVACYSYPKCDKEYGTYEDKQYGMEEETHQYTKCPNCGHTIDDQMMFNGSQPQQPNPQMLQPPMGQQPQGGGPQQEQQQNPQDLIMRHMDDRLDLEMDKYGPDQSDVPLQDLVQNVGTDICPACMQMIMPELSQETLIVTRLIGVTNEPKTRILMDCWGGLYVKIPNYVRKQCDLPYLLWSYETHYTNALERFEHLRNKTLNTKINTELGPKDPYEQWGRLSPQYQGEYPMNVVTIRNMWLRPSAFNVIKEDEKVEKLKKKYPDGVRVVLVNDEFAESENECLDDYWTITYNPLSDYLHHDPLGLLLVSFQELVNDLISLIMQTIEHGISQTFADPSVLNFNAYRQIETVPGGIYEANPKTGKSLNEAFYEAKTATLSQEVMPFLNELQSLAQLVSGALPSLFGGAIEGSETASQYSMSRAQALQRLQNNWKTFTIWWKQIFGKVIPMYIKVTKDEGDEKEVQLDKDGNFINVFIRKAELEGKIGRVELEANENLPMTWAQQKDVLMQLLQASNPEVLAMLGAPENLTILREHIGLTDFFVPGEDDVEETYDDIKTLLNSTPMPTADPTNPEQPSVQFDPIYGNPQISFEIVRKWVISEAGRDAKINNQDGYRNVLLYGASIHQILSMQGMQQAQAEASGAAPGKKPNSKDSKEAPITGEGDVHQASATVQ